MAKHTSKKFFAGMLALSAGMILAGCDPVAAVPKNYNDPIVATEDGNIELDGNNLGTLFDAITGDKNSKVVEQILTEIAEKQFGTYEEFLKSQEGDNYKEFIASHNYFKNGSQEEARLKTRYDELKADLNERISEYFYNEITSGSYNDDLGRFSEKKLYKAHQYELYELGKVNEGDFKTFFVDKSLTKKNALDKLNKAAYQVTDGRGYIKEKVYPDILRNKIVEDYVYRENRSSLGRAYARNVQYVKITYEAESTFEENLLQAFAKKYIEENITKSAIDYELLVDAVKGFKMSSSANALVKELGAASNEAKLVESCYKAAELDDKKIVVADDISYLNVKIVENGTYYKDTKIGKILEDFEKAGKAEEQGRFPTEENQAALDSFTSDGKTKEYGLLQKISSLVKEDYTTDGWYVKNGGLSELPSQIRDRLFNIRVANDLDKANALFNEGVDGEIGAHEAYYEEHKMRTPYMREIYDRKFVLPSDALKFDLRHYNYVLNDTSAKAFYICEVLEAPSTAKLDLKSNTDYGDGDTETKETIGRQVAKVLGTKDSYIKDAYTQLLTPYKFTFFDTSLKDYFKSEYPDLFDDED